MYNTGWKAVKAWLGKGTRKAWASRSTYAQLPGRCRSGMPISSAAVLQRVDLLKECSWLTRFQVCMCWHEHQPHLLRSVDQCVWLAHLLWIHRTPMVGMRTEFQARSLGDIVLFSIAGNLAKLSLLRTSYQSTLPRARSRSVHASWTAPSHGHAHSETYE